MFRKSGPVEKESKTHFLSDFSAKFSLCKKLNFRKKKISGLLGGRERAIVSEHPQLPKQQFLWPSGALRDKGHFLDLVGYRRKLRTESFDRCPRAGEGLKGPSQQAGSLESQEASYHLPCSFTEGLDWREVEGKKNPLTCALWGVSFLSGSRSLSTASQSSPTLKKFEVFFLSFSLA